SGQAADRTEVRVKVEDLAKAHVDALESLGDRRADRPLERDAIALARIDHLERERLARTLELGGAGLMPLPRERDAGLFEDLDDCPGHLGSDAVAWYERHVICHRRLLLPGLGPATILYCFGRRNAAKLRRIRCTKSRSRWSFRARTRCA